MYLKTNAIILRSTPVGEFDFWVRAASAQWGLMTLVLRGARRPGARLKFLKEPGIYADLQLYGKPSGDRTMQLLTGTILESFLEWRESLESFRRGLGLLRFSETFMTPFDPKAEEKVCLILETLACLAQGFTSREALALSFKLKMLDLSGWRLSANNAASYLDPLTQDACLALESGRLAAVEPQSLATLDSVVSLYVDRLIGSASA